MQRARLKHEQQVPNMGLSARPPVSRYQGAIMVTFTERLNCWVWTKNMPLPQAEQACFPKVVSFAFLKRYTLFRRTLLIHLKRCGVTQIIGFWDLHYEEVKAERGGWKISPAKAWMVFFLSNKVKTGYVRLKEIILNEVRFRGSSTIDFALPLAKSRKPL